MCKDCTVFFMLRTAYAMSMSAWKSDVCSSDLQGAVIDLGADMQSITRARAFQFVELGEEGAEEAGGSRASAHTLFRNALREARALGRDIRGPSSRARGLPATEPAQQHGLPREVLPEKPPLSSAPHSPQAL